MALKDILSVEECDDLISYIDRYVSYINSYVDNFNKCIDLFNSEKVVQSLYNSGKFGKEHEEKLIELKGLLDEYNKISTIGPDSLAATTKNALLDQKRALTIRSNYSQGASNYNAPRQVGSNRQATMEVK